MTKTMALKTYGWNGLIAGALAFVLGPVLAGCAQEEPASDGAATEQTAEMAEHEHDDHGHEHADEDHAHEHEDAGHAHDSEEHAHDEEGHTHDDGDHSHDDGEPMPETKDGILHEIAEHHEIIETADTDEALLEAHHVPGDIHNLFVKLRPMLELSDADMKQFDELIARIEKQAGQIDEHAHDENVAMVRAVVEKLNPTIEETEKLVAPDHVH